MRVHEPRRDQAAPRVERLVRVRRARVLAHGLDEALARDEAAPRDGARRVLREEGRVLDDEGARGPTLRPLKRARRL